MANYNWFEASNGTTCRSLARVAARKNTEVQKSPPKKPLEVHLVRASAQNDQSGDRAQARLAAFGYQSRKVTLAAARMGIYQGYLIMTEEGLQLSPQFPDNHQRPVAAKTL